MIVEVQQSGFTVSQILTAVVAGLFTVLLSILTYLVKRFADSVFLIEGRLGSLDTRVAVLEDRADIPRRRKTDRQQE